MTKHYEFILSPIENIIKEATNAIELIGSGIESYPLNEYILKSIFLKMTGFQEQKFKCIAWEMATENYEFRIKFLNKFSNEGFSTYKSKNELYKFLIEMLEREEFSEEENDKIIYESNELIKKVIGTSNLRYWNQFDYSELEEIKNNDDTAKTIKKKKKNNKKKKGTYELLGNNLKGIYQKLYSHRNRLAHNTLSYQVNFPTLEELEQAKVGDNNYIIWFYILIIIDKKMIKLYKEFYESNEDLIFN